MMEKGTKKLTRKAAEFIVSTPMTKETGSTLPGRDFSSKNSLEKNEQFHVGH
jgi:hypothetical protein